MKSFYCGKTTHKLKRMLDSHKNAWSQGSSFRVPQAPSDNICPTKQVIFEWKLPGTKPQYSTPSQVKNEIEEVMELWKKG